MSDDILMIVNDKADIASTNYWEGELAANGIITISCNGGAIRVLLPPALYHAVPDMKTAAECVISRGPWPEMRQSDAVEILFDDGSDAPYAMFLGRTSFADAPPAEPTEGREWMLSVWMKSEAGRIYRALERTCHWRRVSSIPCLKPWGEA